MEVIFDVPDILVHIINFSADFQDWISYMTTCKLFLSMYVPNLFRPNLNL